LRCQKFVPLHFALGESRFGGGWTEPGVCELRLETAGMMREVGCFAGRFAGISTPGGTNSVLTVTLAERRPLAMTVIVIIPGTKADWARIIIFPARSLTGFSP